MAASVQDDASGCYEFEANGDFLYQRESAAHILATFGNAFVYSTKADNLGIDERVRRAFNKLAGSEIAYDPRGWWYRQSP